MNNHILSNRSENVTLAGEDFILSNTFKTTIEMLNQKIAIYATKHFAMNQKWNDKKERSMLEDILM